MEEDLTENGQDMTETDKMLETKKKTLWEQELDALVVQDWNSERQDYYSKRNPKTRNNSTRERAYD